MEICDVTDIRRRLTAGLQIGEGFLSIECVEWLGLEECLLRPAADQEPIRSARRQPNGYLMPTELGFVKILELDTRAYTACETPEYTAPEALLNVGRVKPVDCWISGFQRWGGPISKYFDSNAKSLVKHLLTADLGRRYASLKDGANDVGDRRCFSSNVWASFEAQMIVAGRGHLQHHGEAEPQ